MSARVPPSVCHPDVLSGGAVAFISAVVLDVVLGRCVIIVGAAVADAHDSSQCRVAKPSHGNPA